MSAEMNKEVSIILEKSAEIDSLRTCSQSEPKTAEETKDDDFDDDDASYYQDISVLESLSGVCKEDVENLKSLGVVTIRGFMTSLPRLKLSGMPDSKVEGLRKAYLQLMNSPIENLQNGFISAKELSEQQQKSTFKISTGSKNLDNLLGGGIEAGSITEIFGETGTGKTQLCLTLCATAQIPQKGIDGVGRPYPGGKVFFIDTENTFRWNRLYAIADNLNLDRSLVLDNILYARAINFEHQLDLLNHVSAKLIAEPGIFKLIIVDSAVALLKSDFASSKDIMKRQQILFKFLTKLRELSEEFNVAVLVTNHVTLDMSSGTELYKPSGGFTLAQLCTTSIGLKKIFSSGTRRAKIHNSPCLQEGEADFVITKGGIQDPCQEN